MSFARSFIVMDLTHIEELPSFSGELLLIKSFCFLCELKVL